MNFRWVHPLLCLPILIGGCATKALWEEGRFATFHEPATAPSLTLRHSLPQHKVLVAYDEANERNDNITRRRYWLDLDSPPVKNPHRPDFVRGDEQNGLQLVPVFQEPLPTTPTNAIYAVTNKEDFTIFTGNKAYGPLELPVYRDSSGRVKQILLTPVTIAADATVVGGVLLFWYWSVGGLSGVH